MAKTGKNQKMKMLAIYVEIAANCRGEKNAMCTQSLVDSLNNRNIACDGRVLRGEIDKINEYIFKYTAGGKGDFDKNSKDNVILKLTKKNNKYYYYFNTSSPYLIERKNQNDNRTSTEPPRFGFDFGELLFLYDAVTSAEFMPLDKVKKLHKKLIKLAEYCGLKGNGRQLTSHMYLDGKFYSNNDEVLQFADELCRAIDNKKYIAFKYCNINKDGELEPCKMKNGEEERIVIPVALLYSGGYYYLRAMLVGTEKLYSFRLDKMKDVHSVSVDDSEEYSNRLTVKQKEIITKYKKMDTPFLFMGDMWEDKNFTQFGLRFTENHIGDVIDKFGKDVTIKDEGNGWYSVNIYQIRARKTKELYAWLFQFGTEMQITDSPETINGYKKYLNDILDIYSKA